MTSFTLPTVYPVSARVLFRARGVLPIRHPPLKDGAVLVRGGQILEVGRWKDLSAAPRDFVVDLGEVLLLPGLVNAHCHLDYTDMAGHISPPRSFSDWIKAMLALKAHWTYSDYALSWLHGAAMLLRTGTTTVADIEAVPELLPEVLSSTPLRVCSLLELTGVRSRRSPEQILQHAVAKIEAVGSWSGLSPHAPYSTNPELLRLAGGLARERGWIIATHIAESREEFEMLAHARGPMFEWLQPQREMADCGLGSPIRHLQRQGLLGHNLLAIHANYLERGDAELLGAAGASVVHCPRSHAYFRHRSFPRSQLGEAGVNICLGTDSLATVRLAEREVGELDLWAEMRAMADHDPGLSPSTLLQLATMNGARALGRAGALGELTPGACADMIVLPVRSRTRDLAEAALENTGSVGGVMIGGRWVLPRGLA